MTTASSKNSSHSTSYMNMLKYEYAKSLLQSGKKYQANLIDRLLDLD